MCNNYALIISRLCKISGTEKIVLLQVLHEKKKKSDARQARANVPVIKLNNWF